MAIEKAITDESTVLTNYHRLERIRSITKNDNNIGSISLEIGSYTSEEDRKNGASPVGNPEKKAIQLTELEAALYWFITYKGPMKRIIQNGNDVVEQSDPDITPLVTLLKNWELRALYARIQEEMSNRSMSE